MLTALKIPTDILRAYEFSFPDEVENLCLQAIAACDRVRESAIAMNETDSNTSLIYVPGFCAA
jgi:hypothetical protein